MIDGRPEAFETIYRSPAGHLTVQGNARGDGIEFQVKLGDSTIWLPLDEFSTRDLLLALRTVAVPPIVGPAEL